MSSLQVTATINQAATDFTQLWANWKVPAISSAARKLARETRITNIVNSFNFLSLPAVSFANLGPNTLGGFNWTDWSLTINDVFTSDDDITYRNFLELCRTIYHESRHCEQVYRSAQGLGAYRPATPLIGLKPPDMTEAEMIQMASDGGGGVASKVSAFSGNPLNQAATRVKLISKLLNIPAAQATAAEASSADFTNFIGLAKPAWFKRRTVKLEVEEWMRSIAKSSLFGMTMFVEQGASDMNKMYKDLPVELDAHKIEDAVAAKTEQDIGHAIATHGALARTNATFGP